MPSKFGEDFYVFLTPKDDPESNSYIKIIDPSSSFAGLVFVVNKIAVRRKYKLFGSYKLKFDYTIIEKPQDVSTFDENSKELRELIGDIIIDVWENHYA